MNLFAASFLLLATSSNVGSVLAQDCSLQIQSDEFKIFGLSEEASPVGEFGEVHAVNLGKLPNSCDSSNEVKVNLPQGLTKSFLQTDFRRRHLVDGVESSSDQFQHFHGTTADGLATLEYIRVNDSVIFGSLVDATEDKIYKFSADAEGNEVVSIKTSSDFPDKELAIDDGVSDEDDDNDDDEEEDEYEYVNAADASTVQLRGSPDPSAIVEVDRDFNEVKIHTIRVLTVWTKEAECRNSLKPKGCTLTSQTRHNMICLIALATAETNTAYSLSGVNAKLEIAHTYLHPTYEEKSSYKTMLYDLRDDGDGDLDDVSEHEHEFI